MKPLVSIVIPVYNTEKYVGECLDSLVNQTYKEMEIICVDDGSTDSSREIILDYEQKDARVRLVTQEHSNAGAARNSGLGIAKGEYIAFLDSDDFFETDMIEKMVEKAVSTQADCVICRNIFYDNEAGTYDDQGLIGFWNMQIPDWDNFSKNDIPNTIFQLTLWAWDKLYRLPFIRANNLLFQEQRVNNDILFVLKSYVLAERMAICSDVAAIYRTNISESLCGIWASEWQCIFRAFEELKEWLKEQKVFEQVERSFVKNAVESLIYPMRRLTEGKCYLAYFDYLKHEGMEKLGLWPHDESYYHSLDMYKRLEYISNHNCHEYLFYQINALQKQADELQEIIRSKRWYFQESRLPKGSRVVIYGYGEVGRGLVEQLYNSNRLSLEAVTDRNFELFNHEPVEVKPVQEIYTLAFDYCIIALRDKKSVKTVRNILVDGGICQDKIVWFKKEPTDND